MVWDGMLIDISDRKLAEVAIEGVLVAIVQKLTLRQTLPKREPRQHLPKKLQP